MFLNWVARVCVLGIVIGCTLCLHFCFCENFSDFNWATQSHLEKNESFMLYDESGSDEIDSVSSSDMDEAHSLALDLYSMTNMSILNSTFSVTLSDSSSVVIDVIPASSMENDAKQVSTDASTIVDLKVVSADLSSRTLHLRWTSNATVFVLRYHPEAIFLQNYFNVCMDGFDVVNETVYNVDDGAVHSLILVLPEEVLFHLEDKDLDRLYFAIRVLDYDGSMSNISNVAMVIFKRKTYFASRSKFLEHVLAAIVITSVALSVIVSTAALILIKIGLRQRTYVDFQRSDYYYETVTDVSVDEQRHVFLSDFEGRKSSAVP